MSRPIDPLGHTELSEPDQLPETQLSLPPQTEAVVLPALAVAAPATTRPWMLAAAAIAGIATSVGLAYALR